MEKKSDDSLLDAGHAAGKPETYPTTIALADAPKANIEKLKAEQSKFNPGNFWVELCLV